MRAQGLASVFLVCAVAACGDDASVVPDAGTTSVTTELCAYEPMPPTANAGGTVTAGPLMAGAAERMLDVPVGTALGGYTGRAGFLSSAGAVDARKVKISSTFNPSVGVELAPRVKALALSAGGETIVILKMDAIFVYEGMLFDLEQRLGAAYHGKIVLSASHSHSAWAQFTGHAPLKLGAGQLRTVVYERFLDALEGAAKDALAARQAAKLGVFTTSAFDPTDAISHDRRGENNDIGGTKDAQMALIRIDATDGTPLAIVPIFGAHPTINGEDNPFASADAVGALERQLGEQFTRPVVVMQLQSAGGDNTASSSGHLDCANKPGKASDPCFAWVGEEGHGRAAVTELMAAWTSAGAEMKDALELEMLTRSIELGPHPETFSIRDGALAYAAFDPTKLPDGIVSSGPGIGNLANPIDEFNAPVGAALCEKESAMFPAASIAGTEGVLTYGSCLRLDVAGEILGPLFDIDFGVDATHPVCETTRTNISALRIGDFTLGTMPGELTVPLKKLILDKAPDSTRTIVLGYAQGHVGYLLRPEDWVLGGYEPSVTFWGPLEAEMIAEKLAALLPLARTPAREDGAMGGTTKVATRTIVDNLEKDEPAMSAGTVPPTVPPIVWARTGTPTDAQPATTIPRVAGIATFTFVGDDPLTRTPRITLQQLAGTTFADVKRRSGRRVEDGEIVLAYTPSPLQRSGPQTHFWVAEWQAVPWIGADGLDTLDARAGVPLGTYRFHVEGNGWSLDSRPWDVVAGGVLLLSPTRAGGNAAVRVTLHAPKGWRFLDATLASNQPIPVAAQSVTVELLSAAGSALSTATRTTAADGTVAVPDLALATRIRVTDRFGNRSDLALP